jgi:hypothetical protein
MKNAGCPAVSFWNDIWVTDAIREKASRGGADYKSKLTSIQNSKLALWL